MNKVGPEGRIKEFFRKYNISFSDKFVISVSGGIDSMTLLDLFVREKLNIIVCHFDHKIREEAYLDRQLIENVTRKNGIPFYFSEISENKDTNFHDHAHHERNEKLAEIARQTGSKYIVTAHHGDDLIETILIKITRGSNLLGYSGIKEYYEKDGLIWIKPLLVYSKCEVEEFGAKSLIRYNYDKTNGTDDYLRNRYRHTIVPIMKQENPSLLEQVISFSNQVGDSFQLVRNMSNELITNNRIILDKFSLASTIIQDDAISVLLENSNISKNRNIIYSIRKFLLGNKPNINYLLSDNKVFIKEYDVAYVTNADEHQELFVELVEDNGVVCVERVNKSENSGYDVGITYNSLSFPLILRNRKEGDMLNFHYGHKSLKKHLINIKVPLKRRDELLVIVDNKGVIIWVEEYYINKTLGTNNKLTIRVK